MLASILMVSGTTLYGQNKKGNENYEVVISGDFDSMRNFSDGLAFASLFHAEEPSFMEFGFVDKTGKFVVHTYTEATGSFSEGLAPVWDYETYKWGYFDKSGHWAIPPIFDDASMFSEGLAFVYLDGKEGFINKKGEMTIPATFNYVEPFSEGLAIVEIDGKYGYINKKGQIAIPATFNDAGSFSEGLAVVKIDGKCGYIDKTGKFVIPAIYDDASRFSNGWAVVGYADQESYENRYKYIDKNAHVVLAPITLTETANHSESIDDLLFSEDLAMFYENGKWGYINKKGKIVIPATFDEVGPFSEGFARVHIGDWLDGKEGFINKKGKFVVPAIFDWVENVTEGLAMVRFEDGTGGYIRIKKK